MKSSMYLIANMNIIADVENMTWKRLPLLVYSVLAIHMLHLAFFGHPYISQMISVES